MKKKLSPDLFARFYSGLLSPREEKKLLGSQEIDDLMREQWENPSEMKSDSYNPDFERIYGNIQKNNTGRRQVILRNFSRIAAALLLLAGISASWLYFTNTQKKTDPETIYAYPGSAMDYTLPDGTRVFLTGNSSITFHKNFIDHRNIEFQGLAFFEVAKTGRPFRVFAGETAIEVTGTSFSVSAPESGTHTVVELLEGSVIITGTENKMLAKLEPGLSFTFNKISKEFTVQKTDTEKLTLWRLKKLSFSNAPVSEIAGILEKRFGKTLHISQEIASMRFTFTIENETLEQTLDLICGIAPVEYLKNKDSYLIKASK